MQADSSLQLQEKMKYHSRSEIANPRAAANSVVLSHTLPGKPSASFTNRAASAELLSMM